MLVKGKWTVSLFGQLVLLLKGWVLDVSKHRILLPPFGKKWHGSRLSVEKTGIGHFQDYSATVL